MHRFPKLACGLVVLLAACGPQVPIEVGKPTSKKAPGRIDVAASKGPPAASPAASPSALAASPASSAASPVASPAASPAASPSASPVASPSPAASPSAAASPPPPIAIASAATPASPAPGACASPPPPSPGPSAPAITLDAAHEGLLDSPYRTVGQTWRFSYLRAALPASADGCQEALEPFETEIWLEVIGVTATAATVRNDWRLFPPNEMEMPFAGPAYVPNTATLVDEQVTVPAGAFAATRVSYPISDGDGRFGRYWWVKDMGYVKVEIYAGTATPAPGASPVVVQELIAYGATGLPSPSPSPSTVPAGGAN